MACRQEHLCSEHILVLQRPSVAEHAEKGVLPAIDFYEADIKLPDRDQDAETL
jgi:hypothetical protein